MRMTLSSETFLSFLFGTRFLLFSFLDTVLGLNPIDSSKFLKFEALKSYETAGGQSSVSDRNLGRVQTVLLRGGRSGWLVGRRCDHNSVLISCLPINMRMSTFL
ncbi:hypothetical protein L596_007550 [Steinernema carpocapsae]|uniref:Uncharacterized protein n=1 Tax=Steinernema carpocapsae TaxID=34508 RepID=A0A4V6A629_STECR|nr:hypothetical protein L596_007550 [Steinernema carpocapsae]